VCERPPLWSKAKSYLEALFSVRFIRRETYLALARLLDATAGNRSR
jgi:hypothetical protein